MYIRLVLVLIFVSSSVFASEVPSFVFSENGVVKSEEIQSLSTEFNKVELTSRFRQSRPNQKVKDGIKAARRTRPNLPYGEWGKDVTNEFMSRFSMVPKQTKSVDLPKQLGMTLDEIKSYHVIFVPGFADDFFELFVDYFDQQIAWMKSVGLVEGQDFLVSSINGGARPEINSGILAGEILGAKRPVLLITHSKGSTDILQALLDYPELQDVVGGWVSLQGVFGGAEYADYLSTSWRRWPSRLLMALIGSSLGSLEKLSTKERRAYMLENINKIELLVANLPTISVGTSAQPSDLDFMLKFAYKFFGHLFNGKPNDGLLAIDNVILPFSDYIWLENVSHMDLAFATEFDRRLVTLTIMSMVMDKAQKKQAQRLKYLH